MKYRIKPPRKVLRELLVQSRRHQVLTLEAVDNILDSNAFSGIVPMLAAQELHFNIFYEVKSNLTPEQIRQLKAAGITEIQPGIESLHTEILKLMAKRRNRNSKHSIAEMVPLRTN